MWCLGEHGIIEVWEMQQARFSHATFSSLSFTVFITAGSYYKPLPLKLLTSGYQHSDLLVQRVQCQLVWWLRSWTFMVKYFFYEKYWQSNPIIPYLLYAFGNFFIVAFPRQFSASKSRDASSFLGFVLMTRCTSSEVVGIFGLVLDSFLNSVLFWARQQQRKIRSPGADPRMLLESLFETGGHLVSWYLHIWDQSPQWSCRHQSMLFVVTFIRQTGSPRPCRNLLNRHDLSQKASA